MNVRLDAIAFDAGTQIRAAIDQAVVADYAEAMTGGAIFPAIVLFHDGNQHYLADGFHRFMAAQRIQARDIDADVRPGTKEDALWFALGANRDHGKRLTQADKTNAIRMARDVWPERMQREIAERVGCHPSLVSMVYAKYASTTTSEAVLTGRQRKTAETKDAIRALIEQGLPAKDITKKVGASGSTVAAVRTEMGLSKIDNSRSSVEHRREQIRELAASGHSSRQIASMVGMSEETTRDIARQLGIEIQADKVVGRGKRHDSNRIVGQIVIDAENLIEGINLIEFADLDRAQLSEWLRSLQESRDKLGSFIRRLMKEQQNDQAA